MDTPGTPISRRGALIAGSAAVAAGLGLAERARAATPRATAALTPAQQAGQRVIYSYPGLTPPSSLMNAISSGQCAGVIFFGENISSTSQIASVVGQLKQANAASPVKSPLLLMTDQEGGEVRRLPGAPTMSEKDIGASSAPGTNARNAGTGAGNNLKSVGMNVNLAPVLDVYRAPGDFDDQFERSYSMDPTVCASLGQAFIYAQQQTGVAATAKHFPGLGPASASQNTDSVPVTLNTSLTDLRNIDELPYHSAIGSGVKLIMVSWAVYPALDASRPAGLSKTVVQTELRSRLGFTGVTVTDALEAGALQAYGSTGNRAVLAAQAGMDLIMCAARDVSQGQAAVTALANALSSGTISSADFNAAVSRVTALRNSL
jgi:beta-N-acetylhexosaminidase